MLSFSPLEAMTAIAAASYFFGIYLHYLHVKTIFHLLDRWDELDKRRAMLKSLIWPTTVLYMMWQEFFEKDEDEQ